MLRGATGLVNDAGQMGLQEHHAGADLQRNPVS